MTRYVVTELEGYPTATYGVKRAPGLSVHVIDTAWNRQVVRSWRTEDYGGAHWSKRNHIRHAAAQLAAKLNEESPPTPLRRDGFWPMCPYCKRLNPPGSTVCACGGRVV